ncbi:unnamed protein product, partial [Ectocarpus sp. 4 AP-2014]
RAPPPYPSQRAGRLLGDRECRQTQRRRRRRRRRWGLPFFIAGRAPGGPRPWPWRALMVITDGGGRKRERSAPAVSRRRAGQALGAAAAGGAAVGRGRRGPERGPA